MMDCIVCIKQVPGTNKVEVDETTGVLKRGGVESKMNPYDLYAIETALRLKEQYGGTVRALTMGPPAAKEILYEAFSMGVDDGYLLTDRAFAGADVLATSYALSQAIRMMAPYDLVICGKQTTDGDTAQVGPEIAEYLGIPSISNVTKILAADEDSMTAEMEIPTAVETSRLQLPALICVEKDIYQPRLPSYLKKQATKERGITLLTLRDLLDKDEKHYGLAGSPTQVQRIFPPDVNADRVLWHGDGATLAAKTLQTLHDKKFV